MKGLDLFLVLLILLSWRRCVKSQRVLLQTLFAISLTSSVASVGALSEKAGIDDSDYGGGRFSEGLQNLNSTTSTDINYEKLMKRLWKDSKFPRGNSANGLKSRAHYLYAHDHDFDNDEDDDYHEIFIKDDDSEENNSLLSSESSTSPPWISQSSPESIKHKILEHRRLQVYLRKHHYQHVKRHRVQQKEKQGRSRKHHHHRLGRFSSASSKEESRMVQNPATNITIDAVGDDDAYGELPERSKNAHAHHYTHDSSWKSKRHEQHSKYTKEKHKQDENHRDHLPSQHDNIPRAQVVTSREVAVTTALPTEAEGHKKFNFSPDKVFRHPNRFLDKFYMDTQQGYLDPDNLNSIDLNVSTISELIWKLRGMRSRRRRSFQPFNLNQTKNFSVHENGNTVDSRKLTQNNVTWPLKRIAEIEGDIWLGALMMVHEREDNITCGPIMPQGGVQSLEAMLYTIDWINNKDLIPGVKIGAYILDDCDKDTYGLEQAVDFIKGSISNIDDVDLTATCSDGEYPGGRKHRVIAGVVGAASSVTSIQVANLLRLFKIPQVSYFSTSPELSNKQRFEYFSRTIPSDKHQVKAMVEIVKLFGWRYVSIVYEESNYGIKAFEELERLLPENDICIAAKEKLVKDSGVAGEDSYERIVDKLVAGKAKGVIVYGSDQEVKELMRAVRKRNETGSFAWIGSDGWSARTLVSDGNEREVEGTLSVQPKANPVKGFDKYFLNLNVRNNTRNPWFIEFWEHHWQCKYPNSSRTPFNLGYGKSCSGYEMLTAENTMFESQLQYVSDAVMAFAYALKDMHQTFCEGKPGVCAKMNPVDGTELLEYLKRAEFKGLSEDHFHFDEYGDGPARYNIIHFRRHEESGAYHWTRVGEYNEGVLFLNMSGVQFADGSSTPPVSICSKPCGLGEATRYVGGDKCCWSCLKCVNDQIRNPLDEQECLVCRMGTLPNTEHTECIEIKEEYLRYSDGWAIGAMTFAGVGCILTACVVGVYVVHNDTPVVRASGRELSYVILIGLFFCYALTFMFIIRPNDWICGVQQFMTGFVFTVVYAALLTKTNRIARIFEAGKKSARRPSFISPRSQLVICSMMVSIQVLINVVWMLLQPPKAKYYYPSRQDNFLVCEAYINHSYAVAFWYPLLIICVCTVYAVLTRKIPEAFNESKYIGFTMYTTCIIWLAFVPIYFSTGTQVALRVTSMTVAISLSAYVMIACLFGPKLYIIIFHPERNVRQSMMAPAARYSTIASTAAAGGPASLNASALGGSGGITPIQMTTLKQNHFENSTKATLKITAAPPPVKVDRATQCDDSDVHKDQGKNGSCNKKSLSDSTTTTHVLHTTISTQTEYLCSQRSTKSEKCCSSCRGCFSEPCQGKEVGDQGEDDEKQDVHYNSRSLSSPSEQKPRKLCNHDYDHENFSVSEMSSSSTSTATTTRDLLENQPSAPQNSVVGEVANTSDASTAMMHPHHQHHHQHRHHQPQPQRPQRISFRKEGQPPPPNQQNRSNRNPVLGDSSKVTIIVAKDSGDVLL